MLLSQKFNNTMPIFHVFTYFTLFHDVINYHGLLFLINIGYPKPDQTLNRKNG